MLVSLNASEGFSYPQLERHGSGSGPLTGVKSENLILLRNIWNRIARLLACLASVAAVTYAGFYIFHVNALVTGFAFVLIVLLVAARWGLFESMATSIVAMLCLNYFFIPPVLSLTIADPQNWVALFAFMVTAITASRLSTGARQRAREAQDRQVEVERLYQLGRSLMLIDGRGNLGTEITRTVGEQCGFSRVAYCDGIDGRIDSYGFEDGSIEEQVLRDVAHGESSWFVWRKKSPRTSHETVVAPVSLGGQVLGSLGAVGPPISEPALQAMANLVAITVERSRKRAAEGRIEAARQSERLKGVLLDALAHEFVTPLTSIKGAISTIRSEFSHSHDEDDLLTVAEEEADKLNTIVNESVDMARIEPGRPRIRRRTLPVSDLIQLSLSRMKSVLDGRAVEVRVPEHISQLSADPELASLALRQLIGNAVKYSPPASKIGISIEESDAMITINVLDEGPGIPPNELKAIFERFYRGSGARESAPGMGMGLGIARDIANAHGGSLKAENRPGGGAQFSLTLLAASSVKTT
jgi:two-component system, OmpR family, sensor histidine kinase KdpD